jgi:hypothetical protein
MSTLLSGNSHPRLLGVFAHPDDECFCAGGTLARYVAAGAETMVVSATRGEAGQIRDPYSATRRTLGQVRAGELALACRRLGVQHALCLDYDDGKLKDVDHWVLTREVAQIIRTFRPADLPGQRARHARSPPAGSAERRQRPTRSPRSRRTARRIGCRGRCGRIRQRASEEDHDGIGQDFTDDSSSRGAER